MYHSGHNALNAESGRFSRSPSTFAAGRTAGGGAPPYGSGSQQSGLYPSPYQARHRVHSKHGSRGYKRRANASAGGDGVSAAFGGGNSGMGLAFASSNSHQRGKNERDRFLVDINSGGQRGGAAAPSTLLHARKADADSDKSGTTQGSMWLPSSSHRSTRLSGSGRPDYGGGGSAGVAGRGGREGDLSGGGGRGGEGFGGGGRMSIPQRYTRSRERLDSSSSSAGGRGRGGGNNPVRRLARHRAGGGSGASEAPGKLPSIGGGGGGGGSGAAKDGGRVTQQKSQFAHGGKELVVREEGCETSGVCTIQGFKPGNPRWENQDNYVMEEELGGGGVRLFVVLDGHGELGHLVSRRCSEHLPKIVVESSLSVARATTRMSDDLRTCPVDCSSSGATCVLSTIRGSKISVANLGDSKCVLARLVNGQVCAVPLSEDHKPDRPDERQRILAIGGQVGSRHIVVGSSPSGPIRIPMGPARVWYRCRGEIMGLAMSRSLGDDIAHQAGVSSEPEVMEHEIDASDQFLILATDGVWDVTEIGQAVQIVQGYASRCRGNSWDPQGAASLLAHTARKRWEGLSAVVDDITAMVVRLNDA